MARMSRVPAVEPDVRASFLSEPLNWLRVYDQIVPQRREFGSILVTLARRRFDASIATAIRQYDPVISLPRIAGGSVGPMPLEQ